MAALRVLTEQVRAGESALAALLGKYAFIFFDGFHRFEPREIDLLASLAELVPVTAWLVGTPGQSSWRAVEFATSYLQEAGAALAICDVEPPASALATLGRRLVPLQENCDAVGRLSPNHACRRLD